MKTELETLYDRFQDLGVDRQPGYEKRLLDAIISHSIDIERPACPDLAKRRLTQGLEGAYARALAFAKNHDDVSAERLKILAGLALAGLCPSAGQDPQKPNSLEKEKSPSNFNEDALDDFCDELNRQRSLGHSTMSVQELYDMSFDAHFNLTAMHPWACGNGLMARVLMYWLQAEYGLIPLCLHAKEKEEYARALQNQDIAHVRQFMTQAMICRLANEISSFEYYMAMD